MEHLKKYGWVYLLIIGIILFVLAIRYWRCNFKSCTKKSTNARDTTPCTWSCKFFGNNEWHTYK